MIAIFLCDTAQIAFKDDEISDPAFIFNSDEYNAAGCSRSLTYKYKSCQADAATDAHAFSDEYHELDDIKQDEFFGT